MPGQNNVSAFSLLELLIVLVIIGIMSSLVTGLMLLEPNNELIVFVGKFNTVMQVARQQAIMTGKLHRIVINVKQKSIALEQETEQTDAFKKHVYRPVGGLLAAGHMKLPGTLSIKQFFIDGVDEFAKAGSTSQTTEAWFYVASNGLSQQVSINGVDRSTKKQFHLVLNPYKGQFTLHDNVKT